MNKINYNKLCENIIEQNKKQGFLPSLLLHSCCAPCSSYCIEWLSQFFKITVFYYNPNISQKEEFEKRMNEQIRLISEMPTKNKVKFIEGKYDYNDFLNISKGLENCPEGGKRCYFCYRMRLMETARIANEKDFDYFCTTLSISPLKNAQIINQIGFEIEKSGNAKWLPSDFKKKEGYKRSIQLSHQYNLYRQNFCGCIFSKEKTNEQ